MAFETRTIVSREQWLNDWRPLDVTASSVAALLALHPWVTPLMLHMDKLPGERRIALDGADNAGMRRGRLLEPLVETLIKEAHPDWSVWKATDYIRDPVHRLGATPDYYVYDAKKSFGIVQAKSIEPHVFERSWRDPESGEIAPPVWVGIQASLERHLTGAEFALIAALRVGYGIDFDLVEVPETPGLIERLEQAADAFWAGVAQNEPPPPDFFADADLVRLLYPSAVKNKAVDLTGNNRIGVMGEEFATASANAKAAELQRKALKAELLAMMGDAEIAMVDGVVVATAKVTERQPETKPRAGSKFRDVRFKAAAR